MREPTLIGLGSPVGHAPYEVHDYSIAGAAVNPAPVVRQTGKIVREADGGEGLINLFLCFWKDVQFDVFGVAPVASISRQRKPTPEHERQSGVSDSSKRRTAVHARGWVCAGGLYWPLAQHQRHRFVH